MQGIIQIELLYFGRKMNPNNTRVSLTSNRNNSFKCHLSPSLSLSPPLPPLSLSPPPLSLSLPPSLSLSLSPPSLSPPPLSLSLSPPLSLSLPPPSLSLPPLSLSLPPLSLSLSLSPSLSLPLSLSLLRQLLDMTCQVANALKSQGIKKGDRVVLYLPMIPLAVAIILACARIGAIHR